MAFCHRLICMAEYRKFGSDIVDIPVIICIIEIRPLSVVDK